MRSWAGSASCTTWGFLGVPQETVRGHVAAGRLRLLDVLGADCGRRQGDLLPAARLGFAGAEVVTLLGDGLRILARPLRRFVTDNRVSAVSM
jgi:hypothetical protein